MPLTNALNLTKLGEVKLPTQLKPITAGTENLIIPAPKITSPLPSCIPDNITVNMSKTFLDNINKYLSINTDDDVNITVDCREPINTRYDSYSISKGELTEGIDYETMQQKYDSQLYFDKRRELSEKKYQNILKFSESTPNEISGNFNYKRLKERALALASPSGADPNLMIQYENWMKDIIQKNGGHLHVELIGEINSSYTDLFDNAEVIKLKNFKQCLNDKINYDNYSEIPNNFVIKLTDAAGKSENFAIKNGKKNGLRMFMKCIGNFFGVEFNLPAAIRTF